MNNHNADLAFSLICNTDKTFKSIAAFCGFSSTAALRNAVKRSYYATPTLLRNDLYYGCTEIVGKYLNNRSIYTLEYLVLSNGFDVRTMKLLGTDKPKELTGEVANNLIDNILNGDWDLPGTHLSRKQLIVYQSVINEKVCVVLNRDVKKRTTQPVHFTFTLGRGLTPVPLEPK